MTAPTRKLQLLTVLLFTGTVLMPAVTVAQEGSNSGPGSGRGDRTVSEKSTSPNSSNQVACNRIKDINTKSGQELSTREGKLNQVKGERDARLTKERQEIDAKVAAERARADAERAEHFKKLEEKATTAEQKQAVADFEASVLAAVKARRVAIDAARDAFRAGVSQAIAARQGQFDAAKAAFSAATAAAVAKAKSDCAAGVGSDTIRTNLMAELKSARETFHAAFQNAIKVNPNIQSLIDARKTGFRAADQAFKTAVDAARDKLKTVLKPTTTTPSTQ